MPQEAQQEKAAPTVQKASSKTESGSGSEKENGLHKQTPKKKKRKILDSDDSDDDNDDDEDYSPAKKSAAKKAAKEDSTPSKPSSEVKKLSGKSENKAKESKPKLNSFKLVPGNLSNHLSKDNSTEGIKNILNGTDHPNDRASTENEREHVSKLFPKSTPTKLNAASTNNSTSKESVPQQPQNQKSNNTNLSLAQKIEVSTPKGGSFDVLGSIMKDMTK